MLCPANMLGYVCAIRLAAPGSAGILPVFFLSLLPFAVIPSAVSRAFSLARSAGPRGRGISLRCNAERHLAVVIPNPSAPLRMV